MIFIRYINPILNVQYMSINKDIKNFKIDYNSKLKKEADFSNIDSIEEIYKYNIEKYYENDINFGMTRFGIHRDDLDILFGDKELKIYASQGQSKLGALVLKLAMINYIERTCNINTILLLDDVLLDLDEEKRSLFLKQIQNHQVFYTSTNLYSIQDNFEDAKIFNIENGNII